MVISIIAMLIAILLPALSKARGRAADLSCMSKMRGANFGFQAYFNDFKDYIPPTAGTTNRAWTYNYGSWYECVASYFNIVRGASINVDKPYALACPASPNNSTAFPFNMFATPWSIRLKVYGDPNLSNRANDFGRLNKTGLLLDNGKYGDAIYYMVSNWSLNGDTGYTDSPTHNSRGLSMSFMDGHGEFFATSVKNIKDNSKGGTIARPYGNHTADAPFAHREFWGRYHNGSWAPFSTNYYQYQP